MFLHFSVTSRTRNKFTTLSLFPLEELYKYFLLFLQNLTLKKMKQLQMN